MVTELLKTMEFNFRMIGTYADIVICNSWTIIIMYDIMLLRRIQLIKVVLIHGIIPPSDLTEKNTVQRTCCIHMYEPCWLPFTAVVVVVQPGEPTSDDQPMSFLVFLLLQMASDCILVFRKTCPSQVNICSTVTVTLFRRLVGR